METRASETVSKSDEAAAEERRGRIAVIAVLVLVFGSAVGAFVFFGVKRGDELARVSVSEAPSSVRIDVPSGRRVVFVSELDAHVTGGSARSWSFMRDGRGHFRWDIEVLRDGEVVDRKSCDPFDGRLETDSRTSLSGLDFDLASSLRMQGCELLSPGGPLTIRVRSAPGRPLPHDASITFRSATLVIRN